MACAVLQILSVSLRGYLVSLHVLAYPSLDEFKEKEGDVDAKSTQIGSDLFILEAL